MTLPPEILKRLDVVKARLVYRMLHPDPAAALRELEGRPVVVYLPAFWSDEL